MLFQMCFSKHLRFSQVFSCFFYLLSQTASFHLQTWTTCQALHSLPVWCCWPPWWASLPPPGSPRWAWLSLERCWCGAAGGRGCRERERAQLTNHSCLLNTSQLPALLQHNNLATSTKNTGAFEKLGLAFISIWKGHDYPFKGKGNSLRKCNHKARNNSTEPL